MFEDEQVLEWCIENKVSVSQYFFMVLLIKKDFHKPFHESIAQRYVKKNGVFPRDDVKDLVDRGFVKNYNRDDENFPEFYMVIDEVIEMMKATTSKAEELWQAYPATFDLSNGKKFISRQAGVLGDKENAKKVYLKKIKRSKKKHSFVMSRLKTYLQLVDDDRITTMKLGDWIANEIWDTVDSMDEDVNDYGIEIKK